MAGSSSKSLPHSTRTVKIKNLIAKRQSEKKLLQNRYLNYGGSSKLFFSKNNLKNYSRNSTMISHRDSVTNLSSVSLFNFSRISSKISNPGILKLQTIICPDIFQVFLRLSFAIFVGDFFEISTRNFSVIIPEIPTKINSDIP